MRYARYARNLGGNETRAQRPNDTFAREKRDGMGTNASRTYADTAVDVSFVATYTKSTYT